MHRRFCGRYSRDCLSSHNPKWPLASYKLHSELSKATKKQKKQNEKPKSSINVNTSASHTVRTRRMHPNGSLCPRSTELISCKTNSPPPASLWHSADDATAFQKTLTEKPGKFTKTLNAFIVQPSNSPLQHIPRGSGDRRHAQKFAPKYSEQHYS